MPPMLIHFVKVNQIVQGHWAHKFSFWNLCRLDFATVDKVNRTLHQHQENTDSLL